MVGPRAIESFVFQGVSDEEGACFVEAYAPVFDGGFVAPEGHGRIADGFAKPVGLAAKGLAGFGADQCPGSLHGCIAIEEGVVHIEEDCARGHDLRVSGWRS